MIWVNLGIALLNVSLLIGIITVLFPGSAAWTRTAALAAIKLGGIVLVTVALVHLASDALSSMAATPTPLTGPGPVPQTVVPRVSYVQPSTTDLAIVVFSAVLRSLLLVFVAVVWGALVGLGSAYLVQLKRTRGFVSSVIAVAAWVTPTFLLAAVAQEVQAQIFNLTDLRISGGYGTVSGLAWFLESARPRTPIVRLVSRCSPKLRQLMSVRRSPKVFHGGPLRPDTSFGRRRPP